MSGSFGKANGGGKRTGQRTQIPLPVTLRSLASTRSVALVDVSETGARLRGTDLPRAGEDVDMTIIGLGLFGRVVWSDGKQRGIEFDERLTPSDIDHLRRKVLVSGGRWVTVDERLAMENWRFGAST